MRPRCDGTDPYFFEELEAAGRLGFGETWDAHVCDEGLEVYADGASRRWSAWRPRPHGPTQEEQTLALAMPLFAFGGLGTIFAAAAALAAFSRLRRRRVADVPCPSCAMAIPVDVDDPDGLQLFCPACGAACQVIVEATAPKEAPRARARPL